MRALLSRVRSLFRRHALDERLDEEVQTHLVRMMLKNTWWLVSIGLAVAVTVALLSGSSLGVLLFDVPPYNVVTIGLVCLAMIVIATTAAYIQARRASRVDAMVALRAD